MSSNSVDRTVKQVRGEGYRGRDVVTEAARRIQEQVTARENAARAADEAR